MRDELDIGLMSERIGTLLLDMLPETTTKAQLCGLRDEIICRASKFCGENDIPNNVFNAGKDDGR